MKDYFLETNYKTVEIKKPDSDQKIKYKIYETTDNYDWDKLNEEMIKDDGGAIIFGNFIDVEKIKFKINFSFFLDMSISLCKKTIIDKKILPLKSKTDENNVKLNSYFEHVFIPLYDKIKDDVKINKFFNVKTCSEEEINKIYGNLYDALISLIQKQLE